MQADRERLGEGGALEGEPGGDRHGLGLAADDDFAEPALHMRKAGCAAEKAGSDRTDAQESGRVRMKGSS